MRYSNPSEISLEFKKSALSKTLLPLSKQIVSAILGGAFISVGALLAVMIAGGMPGVGAENPGLVRFAMGAVFPAGLIIIVLAGAQLFTSDCAVLPYGYYHRVLSGKSVLRTWFIVYFGNFVGALLVAFIFVFASGLLTQEPWVSFLGNLATAKTSAPFFKVFAKGIGANWLVCIAVWMSYSSKDVIGKIVALWIPVMCFVALGLEHSIANMFFIPAAIITGANVSMYDFVITNLLPATLGNIVGGAVFVALPYWIMFKEPRAKVSMNVRPTDRTRLTSIENNLN